MTLAGAAAAALATETPAPVFRTVEIDAAVEIGYGLAVADVNGDGKRDVVLADKRLIIWYENPSWQKHVIAENLTPEDHVCVAAADLDGDHKAEIAVGAGWNPGNTVSSGAVFYLRPPEDRTRRWRPIRLHHEPTVHRMRWVRAASGAYDLVVVPLHGRGNKNGQGAGARILAYRMPPDLEKPWVTELIDDSLHLTHNFEPIQWDGDPAEELLVAAREGVFLFDHRDARWEKSTLAAGGPGSVGFAGAGEIRAGKLPGGGRFIATIEPMHGNQLVVYTGPNLRSEDQSWRRRVLDDTLIDGHALVCGDFIDAGCDQAVAGWRAMGRAGAKVGIRWYSPAAGSGEEWKSAMVDDNGIACEDLAAADFNNDGRLDLVAAGRATRNLRIYFNETP
jgi:hypothetical protein